MAAMQQHQHNATSSTDNWEGYEWNVPLDEVIDCTKCPEGCQRCYYKGKHAPYYFRAILVFILFAVIITMVAMIVRFGAYNSKRYTMGAGDERLLGHDNNDQDFSRLFCKALTVKTNPSELDNSISEYVFTSKARFLDHIETFDILESVTVGQDLYPNWAYHLNSNGPHADQVTVESCSPNQALKFNFFCKKSDFQDFVSSGGYCTKCVCHECLFYPCGTQETSCHFLASHTKTYYMTLVGSRKATENVALAFHFRRSRYDLSEASRSCIEKSTCSLELPLKTTDIILKLPQNTTVNPSQVVTDCVPRMSMYIAFFLAIPVGIALVLGLFALCLTKLQKSVMKDVEQAAREREYRQMGTSFSSSSTPATISSSATDQQRPLSPPPVYDLSINTVNIINHSRRAPLVENEQPVCQSLPDYDSAITHLRRATPDPPSYDSLNSLQNDL